MNNPDDNNKFDSTFKALTNGLEPDPAPYDEPGTVQAAGRKHGLNTRGKVVFGAAGLAIVGGSLIGYTIHTDNVAEAQNRATELAIQQQRLDLQRLQITNKIDAKQDARQEAAEKSIQAKVEACVADHDDGQAYLKGTVDACKDQYAAPSETGDDMQEAAASTGDGGFSQGWLVAAGAAGLGVVVLVKRGRRTTNTYYGE